MSVTDTQRAAYRRELERIARVNAELTAEGFRAVAESFDDVRRTLVDTIARLPNGPTRAEYERALRDLDTAMIRWAEAMGRTIGDLHEGGYAAGAASVTEPLRAAGVDAVVRVIDPDTVSMLGRFRADLIDDITSTMRHRISTEIAAVASGAATPGDIAARIAGDLRGRPSTFASVEARARAIVVTELGRVNGLGAQAAMTANVEVIPELRKRWLSSHVFDYRPAHAEAEDRYAPGGSVGPIPVDEAYSINGFPAMYPHDPSLPASEAVNCHCVSIAVIPEIEAAVAGVS